MRGSEATEAIYIGSLYEKETVAAGFSLRKHIFMGSQRIATTSLREGEADEAISYYHTNHLGSTNIVTNSTGVQTARYEYNPYGTLSYPQSSSGNPSTSDVKHLFTGKELDQSGLYYYSARYYDPEIGRFIQPDTIVPEPANPQSFNRYSYCDNNPINYTDPTGHFKFFKDGWKAIVGVASAVISIIAPPLAPAMWAINTAISAYSAVKSGNMEGFLGGLAGGIIGGAIGQGIASGMASGLGSSAFSFAGGAAIGAVEFGVSGFGAGFGAAVGGGASFSDAAKAGGRGAAVGAVTGAAIEGSYVAGWQDVFHGLGEDGLVNASGYRKIAVGSRSAVGPGRHKFIKYRDSGNPRFWEMGHDEEGNIAINPLSTRRATDAAIRNYQIKLATTVVDDRYDRNSNYGANESTIQFYFCFGNI